MPSIHRRRSLFPFALGAAALLLPSFAQAQAGAVSPDCAAPAYVPGTIPSLAQVRQDACQKAVDLFAFLAPQLGAAMAGGSAVLGQGGTLGGLGHVSLGLRGNALHGVIPQAQNATLTYTGAQSTQFAVKEQWVGFPTAEAEIGIFKGIPLGLTNVGGIDAIVTATVVPDVDASQLTVRTQGGAVRFGYGGRLGILQESAIVPGISATYVRRDLPTTTIAASIGPDSVRVSKLESSTTSWRLTASKRILLVTLAAGGGQDTYDASGQGSAYIASRTVAGFILPAFSGDVAAARQKLTRTNVFVNLGLALPFVRLVGELGRSTGGDVPATYNTFAGHAAGEDVTYAAVGARIAF